MGMLKLVGFNFFCRCSYRGSGLIKIVLLMIDILHEPLHTNMFPRFLVHKVVQEVTSLTIGIRRIARDMH